MKGKVESHMEKNYLRVLLLVLLISLVVGVIFTPCVLAADNGAANVHKPKEKSLDEVKDTIKKEGLHWTAAETSLSKLTLDQRLNKLGGEKIEPGNKITIVEPEKGKVPILSGGALPESFDWRVNGGNYVTNIKNQGCNDCWAFASAAALESKVKIVKGNAAYPVDLSEQQIKCIGHGTCTDWNLGGTFDFLVNTGTPYEACFPYVGGTVAGDPECDLARCSCWDKASLTKVTSYDFKTLDAGWANTISRDDLKTAIRDKGPVAVHMVVYDDFMDFYAGGVYQHTASSTPRGGHFVAIIGWNDADQAWICKNSWGTGWGEDPYGRSGENGYFRMAYAEPAGDFGYNVMIINSIYGPAANTAPVADVHGPYSGLEMVPITVTCSGSDTANDCIISMALDLDDDGTYETDAKSGSVSHTWQDDFFGQVSLMVRDSFGVADTDTASVTVENQAPVAIAKPDEQTVAEGQEAWFNGLESYDPGSDTLSYYWDFGDGVNYATVQATTLSYCDNGVYLVTLTVTDDDGDTGTDTVTVTVNNVPPVADAGVDQTVNEGEPVVFSGSSTDAGSCDTFTYSWTFGDGSPAVSDTPTPTHTYCDNGVYIVTLTVTDDDGASDTDTVTVTVNNVAPTVTKGAMDQPNEEFILPLHTLTFHATFSDPSWCDTHTALWAFGDGQTDPGALTEENLEPDATGTVTAPHTYADPGDYLVTVTVTDDNGGVTNSAAWTIHVADVAEAKEILAAYIQSLPDSAFKGKADQRKAAFANMFLALDDMITNEEWNGFINSLQNNVREKADGQVDGKPSDDWITSKVAQQHICMKVDDIVAYVNTFS
jgi:PKD repeat protein